MATMRCLILILHVFLLDAFQIASNNSKWKRLDTARRSSQCSTSLDQTWVTHLDLVDLSEKLNMPLDDTLSYYTDAKYYNEGVHDLNKLYRFCGGSDIQTHLGAEASGSGSASSTSGSMISTPKQANEATEATIRWCSEFVQHLNLCPWAKQSLQSNNAIQIKIIHQNLGLDSMEQVVRESAAELVRMTESGVVDANIGITFVLAIPDCEQSNLTNENEGTNSEDFDFETFYSFCLDLEERLLDEADMTEESEQHIGNEITIAPFHPNWVFALFDQEDSKLNPLNFEKKSPYPTISLVRTSGILNAGEEATTKIGIHNEEILMEYGSGRLETLYNDKVLQNPK